MSQLPTAVVFDCDGTLVDTEGITIAAMRHALAELGHLLTDDDVAGMVGHPWPRTRDLLVERFDLSDADLQRYGEVTRARVRPQLDRDGLVFDDVRELLGALRAADVPLAVCTSSSREHLERMLALPSLSGVFRARTAREDTDVHKPDPTPYLRTIAALAAATGTTLQPQQVTVVEDSWAGVSAGVSAGCWTVAVDRGAGLHDLSHADVVVPRLTLEALVRPS